MLPDFSILNPCCPVSPDVRSYLRMQCNQKPSFENSVNDDIGQRCPATIEAWYGGIYPQPKRLKRVGIFVVNLTI